MTPIAALLQQPDQHRAVWQIADGMAHKDELTPKKQAWRTVFNFSLHIACDGLWHAYGDNYEQGQEEMDHLRQSLVLLGFRNVLSLLEGPEAVAFTGAEDERERIILDALSEERLLQFVAANISEFESESLGEV